MDMLLDAIRRADEFKQVLSQWWTSLPDARLARARLQSCLSKGDHFDTDRLVAAANMLDLRLVSAPVQLPADLTEVRDASLKELKKLPKTDERDSAIQALKRLGAPSLRKNVLARAKLVSGHFHLEQLDEVLRIAVRTRNQFVHGSGDSSFDYEAIEPFTSYLTETLKFVFAAAELIECGGSGSGWKRRPHTSSHWFSRYISSYAAHMRALLAASGRGNSQIQG